MRKLPLEQGSREWLQWRKSVVTATAASSILGINPYEPEYQCWQRYIGLIPPQEENEAMRRGKRLEPEARELFQKHYSINMTSFCVESDDYNFLGASLDGISDCGKYILEIKCNGKVNHSLALKGKIPSYYEAQIQHQLLVTGSEKCYYYSYDGEKGICMEVFPHKEWQENYLPKAKEFWKRVVFFEL